jgi:phospholipase/lecithinase/hemolysin
LVLTPQQTTNFAYGGATTGSDRTLGVPGLLAQVQTFTKAERQANPETLYVIWAGANDYLHGATNPTMSIANLSQAIESLSAIGAKKILVANLPDLGKLPATRNNANASALSSLTRTHNLGLAQFLNRFKQTLDSDAQIIALDVNSLYQEAITNPAKFGFTNVISACLTNQTICRNSDKFLFWDGIHPTTATHKILGEKAFSALKTRIFIAPPAGSSALIS